MLNEIFHDGENYYLSYLPYPSELTKMLDRNISILDGKPIENVGKSETAICIREPWKCLILYGDHREGYKPIASDLEKCKKYWSEHQELIGNTSDSLDADSN